MSGRLSTHVLDTSAGIPAAGMKIVLSRAVNSEWRVLGSVVTNADGRTDRPLLEETQLEVGRYRLVFEVGDYFRSRQHADAGMFLEQVPIEFVVTSPTARYHVPLLVSPWSYSTYRGS